MNDAANVDEICLRRELSDASKTEIVSCGGGNCLEDELLQLMRRKQADRAQLKAAQRIEASLRHMMQHLNQPMRVPTLSAMVGLSESSFFALFKSATGLTPLDFFIRARMRRAGELLEDTTLQIKEVAAMLGYDDQFYFSRLFKLVHGIAPREYRAQKDRLHHEQPRKLKSATEASSGEYLPSDPSRLAFVPKNQKREQVVIAGFQAASPRTKAFPKSYPEYSSQSDQTCSISVPQ